MGRATPVKKRTALTFAAMVKRSKVNGVATLMIANKKLMQHRLAKFKDGEVVSVEIKVKTEEALRTDQQNRALHLYFELLADALNEGGYTVQIVLKEKVEVDWDKDMVKDLLWRTAQKAILKKDSTTDLKKQEDIDKVYDHLNRNLGEKFCIHVEWPTNIPGYWETAPLR